MFDSTSSLLGQRHSFRALPVGTFGAPSAAIALSRRLVRAITTRSRFGSMHRPNWCPLNRVKILHAVRLQSDQRLKLVESPRLLWECEEEIEGD
jgi:hypothetical protein